MSSLDPELRIDELSQRSMVSVRNIREYQDRGLLPPPRREGRVAYYSEDHLARLELISHLLARGYTLATILDLFEAWEKGRDLRAVLGLETVVSVPGIADTVVCMSEADLFEFSGYRLNQDGLHQLIEAGAIVEDDRGLNISRGLRQALIELLDAGVPVSDGANLFSVSRTQLSVIAEAMVSTVFHALLPEDVPTGLPEGNDLLKLTNSVERLIPVAEAVVRILFSQALQRSLDDVVTEVTSRALHQPDDDTSDAD